MSTLIALFRFLGPALRYIDGCSPPDPETTPDLHHRGADWIDDRRWRSHRIVAIRHHAGISDLERLLAMRVFDRVGKRLVLNENGRALLPQALSLLDGALHVQRMSGDPSMQLQSLRIGTSMTIADHLLPGVLVAFLGDTPASATTWESRVRVDNTAGICEAVANYELDIGLIEGSTHEPRLLVHPWVTDSLVFVVSPAIAARLTEAAAGARIPLTTLRDAMWLLREAGSGTRDAMDQALLPRLDSYRRSIEVGSNDAIARAAAAGLGIACLSRWSVADMLRSGVLTELETTLPRIVRRYHWVVHRDKQRTTAMQRLIDVLDSSLGQS